MEKGFIDKVHKAVESKTANADQTFLNYSLRAIMAGMFLTLSFAFTTMLMSNFVATGDPMGPVIGKFLLSLLFGIGLIFIVYFNAELFTSNSMYFSLAFFHKRITVSKLMKVWTVCWTFNFVGSIFLAGLIVLSGINAKTGNIWPNDIMLELAHKKATTDPMHLFFKAILANWVVNLVVYTLSVLKEDTAKIIFIPLGLLPFVYLGFEHSIANMGLFAMVFMEPGAAEAAGLYMNDAIINLVVVTVGNIIGGGILVGGFLAYLNKDRAATVDIPEVLEN